MKDTSLPPIPADLWPSVIPAPAKRPKGHMLTLEIPGFTENLLLTILCRAVHNEMRSAGKWTARIGTTAKREFPSEADFARHSAENGARLLAIYAAIYSHAEFTRDFDPSPADLKTGATRSYQMGLRDERNQLSDRNLPDAPSPLSPISSPSSQ